MGVAGVDARFSDNAQQARTAGVRRGFYHLFRPEHDGAPQADFFWAQITGRDSDYLIAVDVELDGSDVGQPQTPAVLVDKLKAFVERFHTLSGKYPAIYTGKWFWNPKVGGQHDAWFNEHCALWVAEYGASLTTLPRGFMHWELWQYTSSASYDWVQSDGLDLNREPAAEPESFWMYTPFDDYEVTSVFNAPRNYSFAPAKKQLHEGEDSIDESGNLNIYAGRDGTVIRKGFDAKGYGNYITLDFGDGWTCWYAHFERIDVQLHQKVKAKDVLGIAGKSGNATGVHCHLTLCNPVLGLDGYVVDKCLDPAPYLKHW